MVPMDPGADDELRAELRRVCQPMVGMNLTPELKAKAYGAVLEVLCKRLPAPDWELTTVDGDPRTIIFNVARLNP